jgi:transcriptional regulator with GAF, ATPase, and Fis domain
MSTLPDDQNLRSAFDELKAINHVLERITHVQETNHIMSIIINELVDLCGADQGVINLLSRDSGTDLVTVVRHDQEVQEGIPYKVSSQVSGWVLANKKQAVIDDLDDDPRFRDLSSEEGRFQSVICSPMVVRDDVIGIVSLTRTKPQGPFGANEARLAGILATQSAPLLQNAILLEELANKNRLLEQSQRQLRDENARLKSEVDGAFAFENIIGKSEAMRRVLKLASKVSTNDSPALITGPTGTGKELIARAIHFHSPRRDKPFVVKNCGVKTESLLEAELFGHVKGAFTGATTDKPGLFREADGGTIFLDEVGEAPPMTQVAILRVLEMGEIRPVGSSQMEYVDVRVISATNRDLEESIADGSFRQDLFFRLNTFTIEMPPLRQRASDIPLLVSHILGRLRTKMGLSELRVTPKAVDLLRRYDWPGNVRQLENELERAAVVSDSEGLIDVRDLSDPVKGLGVDKVAISGYRGILRDIVDKVEREVITATLAENDGNISRTAELLGLTRKGLKDKKARYGID